MWTAKSLWRSATPGRFLKYLKRKANFDAVNVAGRVFSTNGNAAWSSSTRWASSRATSGRPELGSVKYKIGVKMAGRLTDYVMDLAMENPFLKAELESISTLQLAEVRSEVCNDFGLRKRVTARTP